MNWMIWEDLSEKVTLCWDPTDKIEAALQRPGDDKEFGL